MYVSGVMEKLRGLNFLEDERGGGTVMGLLWFILLVGLSLTPREGRRV